MPRKPFYCDFIEADCADDGCSRSYCRLRKEAINRFDANEGCHEAAVRQREERIARNLVRGRDVLNPDPRQIRNLILNNPQITEMARAQLKYEDAIQLNDLIP